MSNDNENSAVFSSRQNSCNDDAARIEDGKPFQARAAATGKAQSPSVTRLVDGSARSVSTSQQTEGADVHVRRWTGGGSRQDKVVQYHRGSGTPEHTTGTGSSS